jgi:hypothetical protein
MAARRLGELLVAKGKLTQDQLKKALQAQMIWGGHLGTNLIELGYVTEDELGEILAEAHSVRYATYEMLQEIPSTVLDAVPKGLVEKYKLVPFLFDGKKLHLVMLQPQDLMALDEASFATGFQLVPNVTPEIRLFQILEKYYSIPRARRYITLSRELRLREQKQGATKTPGSLRGGMPSEARPASSILDGSQPESATPAAPPPPETREASAEDLSASDPAIYAGSSAQDWTPGDPGKSPPPSAPEPPALPSPQTPSDKELIPEPLEGKSAVPPQDRSLNGLLRARTLEEVCGSLIEEAAGTFRRCAVFARSTDKNLVSIAGLSAVSTSWSIDGLALPFDIPAVDALFADGRTYYIGPPPGGPSESSFYERMGGPPPPNAFLAPIRLDDRIALVFYGDHIDEEVRPREVEAVLNMVQQAGLALDLLALRRKDSPE